MLRTVEIASTGTGGAAPFLVLRLAQLWPAPPATDPAMASTAYARAAAAEALPAPRSLALVA